MRKAESQLCRGLLTATGRWHGLETGRNDESREQVIAGRTHFVAELTADIKSHARRVGFDLVGVCPAVTPEGIHRFYQWLDAGYAGEMHYFARRRDAYAHPRGVLPGVRSLIMLGMNYRTAAPIEPAAGEGRVACYAWNVDYHNLIRERLSVLATALRVAVPEASVRGVVDSAPLLEREFAQLAGLGWIGKNTLLLNRQWGSWFFLAALLTDVELVYDEPHAAEHCGTCRACIDVCPTGALEDAWRLDPRKCISYLTIELRSPIPAALRSGVGDWLFGCDLCQAVCPWNARVPQSAEADFAPADGMNPLELAGLFELSDEQFRQRFRDTPLWRARRRGLLRNAAIVLGNRPAPGALPGLMLGLHDPEPLVRGASAWALGRIDHSSASAALESRSAHESDAAVRAEIAASLARFG